MTLLGFSVTPLAFLWGPEAQSSGSQPWEDVGLEREGSHRAAAATGWLKGGMLLTVPYPTCPRSLHRSAPAPTTALSPTIWQPWHYPLP